MGSFWNLIVDTAMGLSTNAQIAAVVIALIFGLFLRGAGHIITMTVGALILFVVALLVMRVVMDGAAPMEALNTMWSQAANISLQQTVAYFVIFGVVILVISLIRSVFLRGD